ncbi:nucleotide exchange factor GrpE [Nakamurella lactea]|uniref:nucleotide exchange factor GrpE n=1 Tax=Nakamurella lactea TaxID=459515 RepID=UPI00041B24F4|nr:nucleotide exchange factor GrpE [Nakamurella lactea]
MSSPNSGGPENNSGDKPFQFTDRRRFDPTTGARRDVPGEQQSPGAGGFPGPVGPSDPGDPNNAGQPLSVDTTGPELEAAKKEAAERTADLQRVTAEYANYRKRVDRDRELVVQTAKASVLTELFGVLDDLDRAEAHGDLTGAFKAVSDKLIGVMSKLGLERVGAPGDPFDPALHEAVQFTTSSDVSEPTVAEVLRHGYTLSDRLARPAVVVVVGPEHDTEAQAPADADTASSGADDVIDTPETEATDQQ